MKLSLQSSLFMDLSSQLNFRSQEPLAEKIKEKNRVKLHFKRKYALHPPFKWGGTYAQATKLAHEQNGRVSSGFESWYMKWPRVQQWWDVEQEESHPQADTEPVAQHTCRQIGLQLQLARAPKCVSDSLPLISCGGKEVFVPLSCLFQSLALR